MPSMFNFQSLMGWATFKNNTTCLILKQSMSEYMRLQALQCVAKTKCERSHFTFYNQNPVHCVQQTRTHVQLVLNILFAFSRFYVGLAVVQVCI